VFFSEGLKMDDFATVKEIGELHADMAACFLAFASALEAKGILSNAEMREAAQERLLTLRSPSSPTKEVPYRLLEMMAMNLPSNPDA
jgi:hypothetical protein